MDTCILPTWSKLLIIPAGVLRLYAHFGVEKYVNKWAEGKK
jgi:hypothetical protein